MKNQPLLLVLLIISFFACNNSEKTSKKNPIAKETPIVHLRNTKNKYLSYDELQTYISNVEPFEMRTISDTITYNKVVAYDFDGKEEGYSSPISGDWSSSDYLFFAPVILKQQSLNAKKIDFLTDFLFDNNTYGNMFAACFEPHLGVVFYEDFKVKCVVNICLDCNYLSSSIKIPATSHRTRTFESGGVLELKGFSELGREKVIDLSSQLDFRFDKSNTSTSFPNY